MVKVHKIKLVRVAPTGREERVELLRMEHPKTWGEANEALLRWSQDVPRGGMVQPIEFSVFFMDGVKYHGVYDLMHWSSGMPDLSRHVQQMIDLRSGSVRPPFVPRWLFDFIMEQRPGQSAYYEKLGADYQIGDAT